MSYANMDGVPTQTEGVSEILASDWNTYVRDNFDSIKFGHVTVADDTAKSALSVAEGTMVYQLDNQKVFVYSGSSWIEIADLDNTGGVSDAGLAVLAPVGSITTYVAASAPAGWLLCNGDSVPNGSGTVQGQSLNFASLYALLGSTYGSAGKLPDLRGRTPIGAGTGAGLSARTLAATVGNETTADHQHESPFPLSTAPTGNDGIVGATPWNTDVFGKGGPLRSYPNHQGIALGSPQPTSVSGYTYLTSSAGSHTNMQPSLVLSYIIKV